jgi:uncharacterized FlaG/YvyC family protein
MTILEMNIYNTLLAIEEKKALANIEPTHALLIKDNLHQRVQERIGATVSFAEFYKALQSLHNQMKIHLGDTIGDQYVKVVYREINSTL